MRGRQRGDVAQHNCKRGGHGVEVGCKHGVAPRKADRLRVSRLAIGLSRMMSASSTPRRSVASCPVRRGWLDPAA